MAIRPQDQYPGQIDTTDAANYPHGKARNITAPGDGLGTPWEAAGINDIYGFLQSLLNAGSITPNGNPDSVNNAQYLTALAAVVRALSASHDQAGTIELATSLETQTGDDTARAVSPVTLRNAVQNAGTIQTSIQNLTLGFNQSYISVSSSRSMGVTYTNTTDKPIAVAVGISGGSGVGAVNLTVNGVIASRTDPTPGVASSLFAIVPPSHTYSVSIATGASVDFWSELR